MNPHPFQSEIKNVYAEIDPLTSSLSLVVTVPVPTSSLYLEYRSFAANFNESIRSGICFRTT